MDPQCCLAILLHFPCHLSFSLLFSIVAIAEFNPLFSSLPLCSKQMTSLLLYRQYTSHQKRELPQPSFITYLLLESKTILTCLYPLTCLFFYLKVMLQCGSHSLPLFRTLIYALNSIYYSTILLPAPS